MRTSKEGKVTLAASEGVVPAVYLDSVNVETFGIGVTHWAIGDEAFSRLPVAMPADIDAAVDNAMDLFDKVLRQYEEAVNEAVTVPLEQHEFDALVHFTYNVGGPNLRRSRLLRLINSGNKEEAGRTGFHGWLRPPSLRGRRDLESNLFLYGDYGNSPVPVYRTDGNKRLKGRAKVLSRSEVLAMLSEPVRAAQAVAGHSPVARASVGQTQTAFLANVQKWLGAGGTVSLSGLAFMRDLDPMVQFALIGVLAAGLIGAFWLVSKLIFREREKHFLAGVK